MVHAKLVAMGSRGYERTTRRVVAAMKGDYDHAHHRVYKPWITEPGAWLQYDFGAGPIIEGAAVILFCAWLAWSRFRVILALSDRSLASVIAALDTTFRLIGGAPTYVLTDNEKTVTDRHIAGIRGQEPRRGGCLALLRGEPRHLRAVRSRVQGRLKYVKVAKADLVPTEYNLLAEYRSFAELEAACADVATELNGRPHAVTRRPPHRGPR